MERVLVVEDSPTQAKHIQFLLETVPFQVEFAGHGKEALECLRRQPPDIVLTDLEMPEMNGLQLVEAIRKDFAWVPVVLMTVHGSEAIAAMALSKGAASYIPKFFLNNDLVPTLERILELTKTVRHRFHALNCLTKSEFQFILANDVAAVPPIISYLDEVLRLLNLCDANERMRIGVALQEACLNAIYHGNLEVSSDLRQQDENVYLSTVQMRREQAPYSARRVFFDVNISANEAAFVVRDEGPGFDVSSVPDPSNPANLERIGGRGLLLIRTFMDHVEHNRQGNSITMVKRPKRSS